jgi:hypothetical protein
MKCVENGVLRFWPVCPGLGCAAQDLRGARGLHRHSVFGRLKIAAPVDERSQSEV